MDQFNKVAMNFAHLKRLFEELGGNDEGTNVKSEVKDEQLDLYSEPMMPMMAFESD